MELATICATPNHCPKENLWISLSKYISSVNKLLRISFGLKCRSKTLLLCYFTWWMKCFCWNRKPQNFMFKVATQQKWILNPKKHMIKFLKSNRCILLDYSIIIPLYFEYSNKDFKFKKNSQPQDLLKEPHSNIHLFQKNNSS